MVIYFHRIFQNLPTYLPQKFKKTKLIQEPVKKIIMEISGQNPFVSVIENI
jgi:hypothetical protein